MKYKIFKSLLVVAYASIFAAVIASCTKTEYRTVDNPAYIRVFNNLTYTITLDNKEEAQPFFCMFIDPEFDATGKPIGGLTVSDFLDKRNIYAAPNAAHAGLSTSRFNPEYPGKELVPTAPILNGFDLTNWAQVPAGRRRFLFMTRPISNVPFSKLPDEQQRKVFLDTIIDLSSREVYTLHVLQKDFKTKENGLYVRQETFHKQAFSDTLTYVNFYNLSAKGFQQAELDLKLPVPLTSRSLRYGLRDTMNIFITHIQPSVNAAGATVQQRIPNFSYQYAGQMLRNVDVPKVSPYYSFPIFLQEKNKVYANTWQYIQFFAPPIDPRTSGSYLEPPSVPIGLQEPAVKDGTFGYILMDHAQYAPTYYLNTFFPGLTVNVHSGKDNPRTFGVVSSIEIVNGNAFLTTVQRTYPQPIY
ncbi:hypothetical protein [Sphingobacterium thalpophilum]|uniref:DUF4270 domain-containing protein n=1 Tax=Sphingobacterium thalpophilum TaxID=259 RepID=A0A4V6KSD9_9SPHI|nr:hypothetical protein [Sphingobacterium thalpophilum]VTR44048.1 Uncharacterised protein [Sphingobacterium thalpophilum]